MLIRMGFQFFFLGRTVMEYYRSLVEVSIKNIVQLMKITNGEFDFVDDGYMVFVDRINSERHILKKGTWVGWKGYGVDYDIFESEVDARTMAEVRMS